MVMAALMALNFTVAAQDGPAPTPVQVQAHDGLVLSGDYYVPYSGESPAVLLLHQLYTTRRSWSAVIAPLLANGYRVLAVDLRGYGQTRGRINWAGAQADTQAWLAWLYAQPGVRSGAVFIMGSSMGSNLALVGCAEAPRCAGAVAVSPGLNYFGVTTSGAITDGIPALLIYADRDSRPARDVPRMLALAEDAGLVSISVIRYAGRAHGMDLFTTQSDLLDQVLAWMNSRAGR